LADDVAEAFEKRSSSGLAVRLLALCGESLGSPAAFLIHDAVSGMAPTTRPSTVDSSSLFLP
jgi:hypothetical protein